MKASRFFKETTSRTILFRKNINRSNEAWAKFLKDYKDALVAWDRKEFGDDAQGHGGDSPPRKQSSCF